MLRVLLGIRSYDMSELGFDSEDETLPGGLVGERVSGTDTHVGGKVVSGRSRVAGRSSPYDEGTGGKQQGNESVQGTDTGGTSSLLGKGDAPHVHLNSSHIGWVAEDETDDVE